MVLRLISSILSDIGNSSLTRSPISLPTGPDSDFLWARLIHSAVRAPLYHLYFELLLIIGIVWLLFQRRYRIKDTVELTQAERQTLIKEWRPDDLVPKDWEPSDNLLNQFHRCAHSAIAKYVNYNSEEDGNKTVFHLNVASLNFLNLVGDPDLSEAAIKQMKLYGVGSCGPRGFYGTFDVHLDLEKKLAEFMGVEHATVYSYAAATFSSAIPSYAKRTDVIFADEGVGHTAFQGIVASRSHVRYFRHNDMEHLEQLLMKQAAIDIEDPKRAMLTRRFLVVEGLYLDYGDICPLPELVALKYKYKVRILLDESNSIAVLGEAGRGVTEYFGVDVNDIDLIAGSLETALAVCGGFCAGSKYVVGHQELSGQGYCFSASLPPMLASAAAVALDKLTPVHTGKTRQNRLRRLANRADKLFHHNKTLTASWEMTGHVDSPIKHLRLRRKNTLERLEAITQAAFDWTPVDTNDCASPLLLTVSRYVFNTNCRHPPPSIRLALNCDLTDSELSHIFHVLSSLTV